MLPTRSRLTDIMNDQKPRSLPKAPVSPDAAGPTFRSGVVARLAQMPVATLRIWEQRHGAVRPRTSPSGHRLYSPADLQRVLLLRKLTGQGHAIGSIAALDSSQLRRLAMAADGRATVPAAGRARPATALRLAVVGPALAARLQRPAVARFLAPPAPRIAVFDSLAEAARGAAGADVDLLLWHAPALRPTAPRDLHKALLACHARRAGVLYRYAGSTEQAALAQAGVDLLHEPADDDALGAWVAAIDARLRTPRAAPKAHETAKAPPPTGAAAPRRFDDAALTTIAGLSPTLSCECPRHVAELLMQLASFEAYSAGCIHRDAADADLHAYLQQVAGASRALFESALERVARHEGLPLPAPLS